MNFTPLDQAYQIHHGNPTMYNTNQSRAYNPKCIYCSNPNSIALMERQDGGAFRQCINQSCRKQFNSSSSHLNNLQFKDNNTNLILQQQTIQQQTIQQQNPYLPSEPNFISKFNNKN